MAELNSGGVEDQIKQEDMCKGALIDFQSNEKMEIYYVESRIITEVSN